MSALGKALQDAAAQSIRITPDSRTGIRPGDPLRELLPDGPGVHGVRFLTPAELAAVREILGEHWEPYLPSLGPQGARAALRRWAVQREAVSA